MYAECWWGNLLNDFDLEDPEGNGRMIFRWILGR